MEAQAIISGDLRPSGGSSEMEKEHGRLLRELMLTESERSCHVFWQLTRWVWILQHKVGLFSLRACLPGNVPGSCFHIDLITLPH